jgi:hypothetical protein
MNAILSLLILDFFLHSLASPPSPLLLSHTHNTQCGKNMYCIGQDEWKEKDRMKENILKEGD